MYLFNNLLLTKLFVLIHPQTYVWCSDRLCDIRGVNSHLNTRSRGFVTRHVFKEATKDGTDGLLSAGVCFRLKAVPLSPHLEMRSDMRLLKFPVTKHGTWDSSPWSRIYCIQEVTLSHITRPLAPEVTATAARRSRSLHSPAVLSEKDNFNNDEGKKVTTELEF
jgi:hypothetical protein